MDKVFLKMDGLYVTYATIIKKIYPEKCVKYELEPRYHGYLNQKQFNSLKKKWLERNE